MPLSARGRMTCCCFRCRCFDVSMKRLWEMVLCFCSGTSWHEPLIVGGVDCFGAREMMLVSSMWRLHNLKNNRWREACWRQQISFPKRLTWFNQRKHTNSYIDWFLHLGDQWRWLQLSLQRPGFKSFCSKEALSHIIYIPVSKRSTLFFLFGPVRMKKNRSTR